MLALQILVVVVLVVIDIPVFKLIFVKMFGSVEGWRDACGEARKDDFNPFWSWTASSSDRYNNQLGETFTAGFFLICGLILTAEVWAVDMTTHLYGFFR